MYRIVNGGNLVIPFNNEYSDSIVTYERAKPIHVSCFTWAFCRYVCMRPIRNWLWCERALTRTHSHRQFIKSDLFDLVPNAARRENNLRMPMFRYLYTRRSYIQHREWVSKSLCACVCRPQTKQQIFIDQTREFHFDFVTSFCHICLSWPSSSFVVVVVVVSVCVYLLCSFHCSGYLLSDGLDLVFFYCPKKKRISFQSVLMRKQQINEIKVKPTESRAQISENEEIKYEALTSWLVVTCTNDTLKLCLSHSQLKWSSTLFFLFF